MTKDIQLPVVPLPEDASQETDQSSGQDRDGVFSTSVKSFSEVIAESLGKIGEENAKKEKKITVKIEEAKAKRQQYLGVFEQSAKDTEDIVDGILEEFLLVGDFRELLQGDRYVELKKDIYDIFAREGKKYAENLAMLLGSIQSLVTSAMLDISPNLVGMSPNELTQHSEQLVQNFQKKLIENLSVLFNVDMAFFLEVVPNSKSKEPSLKCSYSKSPHDP